MKTMKKSIAWLNAIDKDKYQNFAVGAAIAFIVLIVAMSLGSRWRWVPLLPSVIAVMTAAVVKERNIDSKVDMQDILAILAGGVIIWATFVATVLII